MARRLVTSLTTVVLVAEIRARDASSPRAALAEDVAADRLQAHCACLPLPLRSDATVPHQQSPAVSDIDTRRPSSSSRQHDSILLTTMLSTWLQ